jgi:hypothetical protein
MIDISRLALRFTGQTPLPMYGNAASKQAHKGIQRHRVTTTRGIFTMGETSSDIEGTGPQSPGFIVQMRPIAVSDIRP